MNVQGLRHRRLGLGILTPVALLASSALVYQASSAAFTAQTSNGSNSWSAGSVTLKDDDANSVMFNASGITPGATGTKCINVIYTGTSAADIRFYVNPATDDGLAQYLTFSVEEGTGTDKTGGSTGDCTDFTSTATRYPAGNLKDLSTTKTSYATGIQGWKPAGPEKKWYRLTWTLQNNDAAQGKSSTATFVWEAQNT